MEREEGEEGCGWLVATCFIEADGDLMGERQIHRKLDERVVV
jgi:hypothetical protein